MAGRKPVTPDELDWRVAFACNGGACIQVAPRGDRVIIRDSVNPHGPVLACSRDDWHAFVSRIRHGDFDGS